MSDSTPTISALTVAQVAKLLSVAGEHQITEAMVRDDLELGAPANANGTMNLVNYTAWLVRETTNGAG